MSYIGEDALLLYAGGIDDAADADATGYDAGDDVDNADANAVICLCIAAV